MNLNGAITEFRQRKKSISTAAILKFSRQRAANEAARLSRKGAMAASCELVNEAVNRLIELLYQHDTDGQACNVDPVTGRLLIPAPWGRAGFQHYGLRPTEANILRAYLFTLLETENHVPLFEYDRHQWFLNIFDYADYAKGISYWRRYQMTLSSWKKARKRLGIE
jgi:hypothetical protein